MSSRPAVPSIVAGHSISAGARAALGHRVGAAARSAVRAWHVVRAPAGVLLALLLTFTGLSAMIWLLYQLGSWWVQLAAQPFPGADAGLEHLFR